MSSKQTFSGFCPRPHQFSGTRLVMKGSKHLLQVPVLSLQFDLRTEKSKANQSERKTYLTCTNAGQKSSL